MTFCSKRMQESPGVVFDIVYRNGSAGKACWVALGAGGDKHIWTDCGWRYDDGKTNNPIDIVAYAPRTAERWMVQYGDGTLRHVAHDDKPMVFCDGDTMKAVRVRITVIDEEAP